MPIETEEYKGYKIEIRQDEYAESPREWDNLGKMICFHGSYDLGDKHELSSSDFNSWGELEEFIYKEYNPLIVLPLYLYDHSGITMNTAGFHCPWDSGQVGFIYVPKENVRKEWNVKRISPELKEKVKKLLISEVKNYDSYISGDVYWYSIIDENGNTLDTLSGFFGDNENSGLLEDAKNMIDHIITTGNYQI